MADLKITELTETTDNENIIIPVVQSSANRRISEKSLGLVKFNTETANYILELTDANLCVEMNVGSGNTCTVPPNTDVAFPVGTQIEIMQLGAGQTTIVAGSGVTLRSANGLKITDQYAGCVITKRDTNEWYVVGSLEV